MKVRDGLATRRVAAATGRERDFAADAALCGRRGAWLTTHGRNTPPTLAGWSLPLQRLQSLSGPRHSLCALRRQGERTSALAPADFLRRLSWQRAVRAAVAVERPPCATRTETRPAATAASERACAARLCGATLTARTRHTQSFHFLNHKCLTAFKAKGNPRKCLWTAVYRRMHHKGAESTLQRKKKTRKVQIQERAIVGASLELLKEKRFFDFLLRCVAPPPRLRSLTHARRSLATPAHATERRRRRLLLLPRRLPSRASRDRSRVFFPFFLCCVSCVTTRSSTHSAAKAKKAQVNKRNKFIFSLAILEWILTKKFRAVFSSRHLSARRRRLARARRRKRLLRPRLRRPSRRQRTRRRSERSFCGALFCELHDVCFGFILCRVFSVFFCLLFVHLFVVPVIVTVQ